MNSVTFSSRVTTAVVAGVAGFSSYRHIVEVAQRAGEHTAVAAVLPLSIDGLIVVGTMAMVEDKRAGRRPRISARVALGFGVVATLAANIASAQPHLTARLVAAVPAVAFLITVEVLARIGRIREQQEAPEVAHQSIDEPALPAAKAPVFLAPVSAPPVLPEEPVSGAPVGDESAGQKVRQDTRTAQQVEDAVRAMRAASPRMSQRKIAEAVMVPPTTVRRILAEMKVDEVAQPKKVNGSVPALAGAGASEKES